MVRSFVPNSIIKFVVAAACIVFGHVLTAHGQPSCIGVFKTFKTDSWLLKDLSQNEIKSIKSVPVDRAIQREVLVAMKNADWTAKIFNPDNFDQQKVLRAALDSFELGQLTIDQLATMSLRWSIMEDFKDMRLPIGDMVPEPMLDENGNLNPLISSLLKRKDYEPIDQAIAEPGLDDAGIEKFRQQILKSLPSERFFWVVKYPKYSNFGLTSGHQQVFESTGRSSYRITLVSESNANVSEQARQLNLGHKENALLVHSLSTMQAFLDASFGSDRAVRLSPQIGIAELSTLYEQIHNGHRAFIINFPGAKPELEADGLWFGRYLNSHHDNVHSIYASNLPKVYFRAVPFFARVAEKFQAAVNDIDPDTLTDSKAKLELLVLKRNFTDQLFFDHVNLGSKDLDRSIPINERASPQTIAARVLIDFKKIEDYPTPARFLVEDMAKNLRDYVAINFPVKEVLDALGPEAHQIFKAHVKPTN